MGCGYASGLNHAIRTVCCSCAVLLAIEREGRRKDVVQPGISISSRTRIPFPTCALFEVTKLHVIGEWRCDGKTMVKTGINFDQSEPPVSVRSEGSSSLQGSSVRERARSMFEHHINLDSAESTVKDNDDVSSRPRSSRSKDRPLPPPPSNLTANFRGTQGTDISCSGSGSCESLCSRTW